MYETIILEVKVVNKCRNWYSSRERVINIRRSSSLATGLASAQD